MSVFNFLRNQAKAMNDCPLKDPGASGTIEVRQSGMLHLRSATAESRTLPRPGAKGQILWIDMETDGGDITLTVTGGYNEDGDTTFTFSDPGQFLLLYSTYESAANVYHWRKFSDYTTGNATPTELGFLNGITAGTALPSKALVLDSAGGIGAFKSEGGVRIIKQAAPTAKTTSTTLAAAELIAGIITGNQGAAGAATYTTDTGTAIETALAALLPSGGALANDDSFDFSVINISTVAAEVITIAAGATVTLVGDMTLAANAVGDQSGGLFRCRRTAANTYTIYRIA